MVQGATPAVSISLSTFSLLGLLSPSNVTSIKAPKPVDYTVKMEKTLKELGMATLEELQKICMAIVLTTLMSIGKSQVFTGKNFPYICRQLGVDTGFAADLWSSGKSILVKYFNFARFLVGCF